MSVCTLVHLRLQALTLCCAAIALPPAFAQEPIDQLRRELAALRAEVQQLRAQVDALKAESSTAQAPFPAIEILQTQLAELAQTKVESGQHARRFDGSRTDAR